MKNQISLDRDVCLCKLAMALLGCLAAFTSVADADPQQYYLIASEKKSSAAYAIDNADGWQDSSNIKCAAGALDPNAVYVVCDSKHLTSSGTHVNFAGKRLELGTLEPNGGTAGTMRLYANTSISLSCDGLCLNKGSISVQHTAPVTLAGDVEVKSQAASPFALTWAYGDGERNVMLTISGALCGDSNAQLNIGGRDSINKVAQTNVLIRFSGNCSAYGGTLNFVKSSGIAECSDEIYGTKALFDDTALPGTIVLGAANMLGVATTNGMLTAGTLSIAGGTRIVVPVAGNTNGIIRVTDTCTVAGPVEIEPVWEAVTDWQSGAERRYAVLKAPYGSVFTENDFVLLRNDTVPSVTLELRVFEDAETQTRTLAIVRPATMDRVELVEGDVFQRDVTTYVESAFDRASAWSDGRLPHADADYVVAATNGADVWISTRTGATSDYSNMHSFTLGAGGCMNIRHTGGISMPGFTMLDGSRLWLAKVPSGSSAAVTGTLDVPSGSAEIGAYNGRTLTIAATLSGAGRLVFCGETGTSAYRGQYILSGINENFLGTICLVQNKGFGFDDNYQSLLFSDARNLGGMLEEFNWKAVSISDMAVLEPRNSVTLEADSNRGLYLGSNSRINVRNVDHTFKVAWPVTLDGHFYKMGSGMLELASALGFASADGLSRTDSPVPGKNLVTVHGGCLAVSHVDAINGAQVAFSNDTSLVLNADIADADLSRWGARNVKTDVPFLLEDGAELSVRVSFPSEANIQKSVFTQGVVTVTSAAASALDGHIAIGLEKRVRGYEFSQVTLDEGGMKTYALVFERCGMCLIIR